MEKTFLCPLPWISLSFGPNTVPRVCCHQSGVLKANDQTISETMALSHNSEIRKKMLRNEIPSECSECHMTEKSGCLSPRQQYLDKFGHIITDQIKIQYLDVTIDNRCNLECIMCSPSYSHKLNSFFSKELQTKNTGKWEINLSDIEINNLLPDLKMLTLTGGEPLLSKRAMAFLLNIADSKHASHISLRLFSNLTFLPEGLEELLKNFESVELILSIDSIGHNYELIRYPSKWSNIQSNISTFKKFELKNTKLNFHSIIMANNWNYLPELIKYYQNQNINSDSLLPIFVEIQNPAYLHPRALSPSDLEDGLKKINQLIAELRPKNSYQQSQLNNFINVIQKIAEKNSAFHIDHKIYMNKIQSYRKDNSTHVL